MHREEILMSWPCCGNFELRCRIIEIANLLNASSALSLDIERGLLGSVVILRKSFSVHQAKNTASPIRIYPESTFRKTSGNWTPKQYTHRISFLNCGRAKAHISLPRYEKALPTNNG
jgi:hypothetical protein